MIARGRLTRTDLILKSLREERGGERVWAASRKRDAQGKVRRWACWGKPGWLASACSASWSVSLSAFPRRGVTTFVVRVIVFPLIP